MTIDLTEAQKIKILNSYDVYRVMQEILLREQKIDQDKEHFWMVRPAKVCFRLIYVFFETQINPIVSSIEPYRGI